MRRESDLASAHECCSARRRLVGEGGEKVIAWFTCGRREVGEGLVQTKGGR